MGNPHLGRIHPLGSPLGSCLPPWRHTSTAPTSPLGGPPSPGGRPSPGGTLALGGAIALRRHSTLGGHPPLRHPPLGATRHAEGRPAGTPSQTPRCGPAGVQLGLLGPLGPASPWGLLGPCWAPRPGACGPPPGGLLLAAPPWPAGVCFYIAFARFVFVFFCFFVFSLESSGRLFFFVYLLFFCFFGGGGARVVVWSGWFWVGRCCGWGVCFGLVRLVEGYEDAGLLP